MIWRYQSPDDQEAKSLVSALGISLPLARLLVGRGLPDPELARRFLSPHPNQLRNPYLLKDMDRAVERMGRALAEKERVFVFGDYDVDGLTSIAQIVSLLKAAGSPYQVGQPHRLREGYGLNREGVERALEFKAGLLLTLDCGTEAAEEIEYAQSRGLDVIVIDHHRPTGSLPKAFAILNPNRGDCPYPFKGLAAAGVVFKFLHGGKDRWQVKLDWEQLYQLAALGTVADVTPLIDENRVLATVGLHFLSRRPHPALRGLLDAAGIEPGPVTASNLAFQIAPRLNAAGRMGQVELARRLITSSDGVEIAELARQLDQMNRVRRDEQDAIYREAGEMIEADRTRHLGMGIVVAGQGWNKGIVGIVASKLQEKYYRPTVVIGLDGEQGSGSARSIPGFNLFAAISDCREHLLGFGGHRAAAGLRIESSRIDTFRRAFQDAVDRALEGKEPVPELEIDATLKPSEIGLELLQELERLEPCGEGNPRPIFLAAVDELPAPPRVIGKAGNHLKFGLPGSPENWDCLGWGMADRAAEAESGPLDLAFQLKANEFRGTRRVQLILKDFRPSSPPAPPVAPSKN